METEQPSLMERPAAFVIVCTMVGYTLSLVAELCNIPRERLSEMLERELRKSASDPEGAAVMEAIIAGAFRPNDRPGATVVEFPASPK